MARSDRALAPRGQAWHGPRPRDWRAAMADGRLFIGTRRYSSWSMRGWLAVRLAGLDVEEEVIPLTGGGAGQRGGAAHAGRAGAVSGASRHPGLGDDRDLRILRGARRRRCGRQTLRGADPCAGDRRRDACGVPRAAPGDADGARAATAPGAAGPRRRWRDIARIEAHLARDAGGVRRGRAVPVRGASSARPTRCIAPVVARLLTYLPRARRRHAGLLRGGAGASAGRRVVRRRRRASR